MPVGDVAVGRGGHAALAQIETGLVQRRLHAGDVALGDLLGERGLSLRGLGLRLGRAGRGHTGFRLLLAGLGLRDAALGLVEGGVRGLSVLHRLLHPEHADRAGVQLLQLQGDLLFRFRQVVRGLGLGDPGLRLRDGRLPLVEAPTGPG